MGQATTQFIVSLFITIISFLLAYFFAKKPQLRFFYGAVTEIPLPPSKDNVDQKKDNAENTAIQSEKPSEQPATPPRLFVRSHTVVVTNQGNATAHNVRIGHFVLPDAYTVYPPMNVPFDESNPKNEIFIPTLSPKETVTISYLYFNNLFFNQINAYIKCDESVAEIANLQHVSVKSPFLKRILGIIFFIGITTLVYWIIKISFCLSKICMLTHT